ncbi:MAG TPA: hypothetical protein VGV41_16885 [Pseudolabrys sp.]|jgi:hypothetical protein|uniref:hypothetical protein n=1 Tax=Pseudolabrys sp. TaxID=1960880 RepID=UPI002DDCCC36|nr:hypothetical protein [Pseudolabrys sp.]HEV2630309.1 hypothetical protein [Pseudolabrys sp.]
MADKMGLGMIGMLLCAATLFVIAVGGFVVRGTLTSGTEIGGNVYGLQSIRLSDTPRLRVVADDRS